VGADIQDGRLVIVDDRPAAGISVAASMIPFLEHDTENRILMGANMMRQWLVPPDPEPALIQTGHEPVISAFWCGRNLLTAFIAWDAGGLEDGLVLSASCARRLSYPTPVEPGDKLSNRHGTKGVVSQILPDAEMPHLTDGTPVEIIYSCMGVPTRGTVGQLREAVLSRVARVEGGPVIVPPFQAPSAQEIRALLTRLGLPADGMEYLTLGRDGALLQRPSTVGWVYWGRTNHLAQDKLEVRRG
jgi:DNA-directed RNA polymerase beta subunit